MKALPRTLLGAIAQLALLAFAGYLSLSDDALPGASLLARAGIVTIAVVLAVTVGEMSRMRAHMAALIEALRGGAQGAAGRDDRAAVDVLVRALSSDDADVRAKAHRNLVRITGQNFTMDPEAWNAWWVKAKDSFQPRGAKREG